MVTMDLGTWEEFEAEVKLLRGKYEGVQPPLLFRGQGDSKLGLTTTLERSDPSLVSLRGYLDLTHYIKSALETFTNVTWDVPDLNDELNQLRNSPGGLWFNVFPSVQYYRYLVYLRHHGFPSPLLDWTRSPYIAAFFAFRNPEPIREKTSIYAYCEMPGGSKTIVGPSIHVVGPYVRSHPRHFRQQSDYTMCLKTDESKEWFFSPHEETFGYHDRQDLVWKFNLPFEQRTNILRRLEDYNLNAYSLFGSDESLLETLWTRERTLKRG